MIDAHNNEPGLTRPTFISGRFQRRFHRVLRDCRSVRSRVLCSCCRRRRPRCSRPPATFFVTSAGIGNRRAISAVRRRRQSLPGAGAGGRRGRQQHGMVDLSTQAVSTPASRHLQRALDSHRHVGPVGRTPRARWYRQGCWPDQAWRQRGADQAERAEREGRRHQRLAATRRTVMRRLLTWLAVSTPHLALRGHAKSKHLQESGQAST